MHQLILVIQTLQEKLRRVAKTTKRLWNSVLTTTTTFFVAVSCSFVVPGFPANCVPLVKAAKGHTPAHTSHPSRPSFDIDKANAEQKIEASPDNHQTAKSSVSEFRIPLILTF